MEKTKMKKEKKELVKNFKLVIEDLLLVIGEKIKKYRYFGE